MTMRARSTRPASFRRCTADSAALGGTRAVSLRGYYLDGVIDTVSCVSLRSVMDGFVDRGTVNLVIDMSRVEYVSSSGWGVFASRIKDIRALGGDIKIFGMDEEVSSIFHMLGFDSIMRSFGVLAEAIENFKNAPPSAEGYDFRSAYRRRRPAQRELSCSR